MTQEDQTKSGVNMLNNFIGGGQVFLHKIRMFSQVFFRTLHVSMFIGIFIAVWLNWSAAQRVDWDGFLSYRGLLGEPPFVSF